MLKYWAEEFNNRQDELIKSGTLMGDRIEIDYNWRRKYNTDWKWNKHGYEDEDNYVEVVKIKNCGDSDEMFY